MKQSWFAQRSSADGESRRRGPLFSIRRRAAVLAGLTLIAGTLLPVAPADAGRERLPSHPAPSAANPTLQGPVTGGLGAPSLTIADYPLSDVGYAVSEYFFSGTANSYVNTAPLDSDGKWAVEPATTADYTSRLVVIQPADPGEFSGNVVVEWFNVSGGSDGAPDWSLGHNEIIRNGDVYVGVSAQSLGVQALKQIDPGRYSSLVHPGDSYSYDIYSQAGQAIRSQASVLMPGLSPRHVIAVGESQSAFRLTTYVNAIAPLVNVYDSYLIHSRSGTAAALSQTPQTVVPAPPIVFIRDDSAFPVLTFQTETDVAGPLNYLPARQPDSASFRLWEAAGTAHGDTYLVTEFQDDNGSWASHLAQFASLTRPPSSVSIGFFELECPVAFNAGQQHYVFQAALHALEEWTRTGRPPKSMPLLDVDMSTTPPSYLTDAVGNVTGGIRTPAVDAPIAILSGLPPAGAPGFCLLFGQTIPLTPSEISSLYPERKDFEKAWSRAVRDARKQGGLLPVDAKALNDVIGR